LPGSYPSLESFSESEADTMNLVQNASNVTECFVVIPGDGYESVMLLVAGSGPDGAKDGCGGAVGGCTAFGGG
jgi:hypothetical protein